MAKARKIGNALSALGLVGMLAACASPGNRFSLRLPSAKTDAAAPRENAGLAIRAQAALEKGDHAAAIDFAERAVAGTPANAAFRALLGNAYFAAGRFASAEQAYNDSLSLNAGQPPVILKLALVQVAQGKSVAAAALLDASRGIIDPADHGLALALAGRPADAIAVLDPAARTLGADARVRQNLALAHALAGDWTMARLVAEQDLAANEVEARIAQWMAFAKPARPSDQVAALTGVVPAAVDPGQPVRLALTQPQQDARMAAADLPQPVAQPAEVAEAPVPLVVETAAADVPQSAPAAEPLPAVPAEVVAAAVPAYAAPMVEAAPPPPPAAPVVKASARPALSPRARLAEPRKAAASRPASPGRAVVQLGAFSSKANVDSAWNRFAARYPALRGYDPATARAAVNGATVYRLSVAGFASNGEAQRFCASLKNAGANCFVRAVAGREPVRVASR